MAFVSKIIWRKALTLEHIYSSDPLNKTAMSLQGSPEKNSYDLTRSIIETALNPLYRVEAMAQINIPAAKVAYKDGLRKDEYMSYTFSPIKYSFRCEPFLNNVPYGLAIHDHFDEAIKNCTLNLTTLQTEYIYNIFDKIKKHNIRINEEIPQKDHDELLKATKTFGQNLCILLSNYFLFIKLDENDQQVILNIMDVFKKRYKDVCLKLFSMFYFDVDRLRSLIFKGTLYWKLLSIQDSLKRDLCEHSYPTMYVVNSVINWQKNYFCKELNLNVCLELENFKELSYCKLLFTLADLSKKMVESYDLDKRLPYLGISLSENLFTYRCNANPWKYAGMSLKAATIILENFHTFIDLDFQITQQYMNALKKIYKVLYGQMADCIRNPDIYSVQYVVGNYFADRYESLKLKVKNKQFDQYILFPQLITKNLDFGEEVKDVKTGKVMHVPVMLGDKRVDKGTYVYLHLNGDKNPFDSTIPLPFTTPQVDEQLKRKVEQLISAR